MTVQIYIINLEVVGDQQMARFGRRKFLRGAAVVGTAGSGMLFFASEASGQTDVGRLSDSAADSVGVVVGTADNGLKKVQFGGEDTTPIDLDLDIPHRGLRDGDKVVAVRQPATGRSIVSPLFLSILGQLEQVDDDAVVVNGVSAAIDDDTMVYLVETRYAKTSEHRRERTQERIRTVPFGEYDDLALGTQVGILAIQNERDNSRTVHALYPVTG